MPLDLPTDRDVHTTSLKVRFYELDPYNHVNHTNYFSYFETARIEYLTDMGWGMDVMKEQGTQIVVVDMQARFQAAALFGEKLTVYTWVAEVARVRSTWSQIITRGDDEVVAKLTITAAFTDLTGRPRRVPDEFAELAQSLRH